MISQNKTQFNSIQFNMPVRASGSDLSLTTALRQLKNLDVK